MMTMMGSAHRAPLVPVRVRWMVTSCSREMDGHVATWPRAHRDASGALILMDEKACELARGKLAGSTRLDVACCYCRLDHVVKITWWASEALRLTGCDLQIYLQHLITPSSSLPAVHSGCDGCYALGVQWTCRLRCCAVLEGGPCAITVH